MRTVTKVVSTLAVLLLPAIASADYERHQGGQRHNRWGYNRPYSSFDAGGHRPPDYRRWNGHGGNFGYGRGLGFGQIRQGVRSGALSNDELRDLRGDLRDIRRKENRYLADGRLSKDERRSLRDDYNDFREDLNHELRDGERRRRW